MIQGLDVGALTERFLKELEKEDVVDQEAKINALRKQQFAGMASMVPDLPGVQKMGQAAYDQATTQLTPLQDPDRPLKRLSLSTAALGTLDDVTTASQDKHLGKGWFQKADGSIYSNPDMVAGMGESPDSLDMNEIYKLEGGMRDDFRKDTQTFDTVSRAWGNIQNSMSGTGASDMSLIFSFMKMLDPGSTVREGEYANAQNTASVPETIRAKYNQAVQSDSPILGDIQRKNFLTQGGAIYNSALDNYEKVSGEYSALAGQYPGTDPGRVTFRGQVAPRYEASPGGPTRPVEASSDSPTRPSGVPAEAVYDPETQRWRRPK